jgi:hypothetical protein
LNDLSPTPGISTARHNDTAEAGLTQDTGIVDQDVNGSKRLDSLLNDLFTIRYGSGGSGSLSAGLLDLLDDLGTCFG